MARRISTAQIRSRLRQVQQKQRQAVTKYNNAVRKHNQGQKRAVDNYNREVRAHNARVRSNRQRLRQELSRLSSSSSTTHRVTYRQSVTTLRTSFSHIESATQAGTWSGGEELLDLSEGEAANSVAVLNALLAEPDHGPASDDDVARLQATSITSELLAIDPDLDARWRGALFSMNPDNPDAARHFCTSSREILDKMIVSAAPDDVVMAGRLDYERTPDGGVSRRARIRFSLEDRGTYDPDLQNFVEEDLNDIVALFREFNDGTHGSAGRFDLGQLSAIKVRVEGAIQFLHRIVSG